MIHKTKSLIQTRWDRHHNNTRDSSNRNHIHRTYNRRTKNKLRLLANIWTKQWKNSPLLCSIHWWPHNWKNLYRCIVSIQKGFTPILTSSAKQNFTAACHQRLVQFLMVKIFQVQDSSILLLPEDFLTNGWKYSFIFQGDINKQYYLYAINSTQVLHKN